MSGKALDRRIVDRNDAMAILLCTAMCRCTGVVWQITRFIEGTLMMATARQRSIRACTNCNAPAKKLGRLVVTLRSGPRRTLLVCHFCYLQLAPYAKNRPVR